MPEFTQDLFDSICEQIAQGKSLQSICKSKSMPSTTSVMKWLAKDENLVAQYARARELQAEYFADAVVQIADDKKLAPEHKRVMIDARKWVAGKQAPKKYGEKLDANINHSGGVRLTVSTGVPDDE
jgi:hypothetical protein